MDSTIHQPDENSTNPYGSKNETSTRPAPSIRSPRSAKETFFETEELLLQALGEVRETYSLRNLSEVNRTFFRIIAGEPALRRQAGDLRGPRIHRMLLLGSGVPIFDHGNNCALEGGAINNVTTATERGQTAVLSISFKLMTNQEKLRRSLPIRIGLWGRHRALFMKADRALRVDVHLSRSKYGLDQTVVLRFGRDATVGEVMEAVQAVVRRYTEWREQENRVGGIIFLMGLLFSYLVYEAARVGDLEAGVVLLVYWMWLLIETVMVHGEGDIFWWDTRDPPVTDVVF